MTDGQLDLGFIDKVGHAKVSGIEVTFLRSSVAARRLVGGMRFRGPDSITRDYTSARISTKDRYSFRYGMFEARLQTPVGQGIWPAFWALGTDIDRLGWPECGESDVMEHLGHEPRTGHGGCSTIRSI